MGGGWERREKREWLDWNRKEIEMEDRRKIREGIRKGKEGRKGMRKKIEVMGGGEWGKEIEEMDEKGGNERWI